MVDIGNDAVSDITRHRRDQRDAARGHVNDLAGIFSPIRQHVTAEKVHRDALVPSAFLGMRSNL